MNTNWLIFIIGLGIGAVPVWVFQGARLDAVQARFDGFVETTRVIGEQAAKEAKAKELADKRLKEKSDAKYSELEAANLTLSKRLRERTSSRVSYLPPTAPTASNPDRACFRRNELDAAIRTLDAGILGVAESGEHSRNGLNVAKEWAQGR